MANLCQSGTVSSAPVQRDVHALAAMPSTNDDTFHYKTHSASQQRWHLHWLRQSVSEAIGGISLLYTIPRGIV
jgi:hypothetical protein